MWKIPAFCFGFLAGVISRLLKIKRNFNDFPAMSSSIFADLLAECFTGVERKEENVEYFLR
jgi:hypothetical protein